MTISAWMSGTRTTKSYRQPYVPPNMVQIHRPEPHTVPLDCYLEAQAVGCFDDFVSHRSHQPRRPGRLPICSWFCDRRRPCHRVICRVIRQVLAWPCVVLDGAPLCDKRSERLEDSVLLLILILLLLLNLSVTNLTSMGQVVSTSCHSKRSPLLYGNDLVRVKLHFVVFSKEKDETSNLPSSI